MKIFWIGLSMMLPVLAQTPGVLTSRQDERKRLDMAADQSAAQKLVVYWGSVVKYSPYSADAVTQTTQVLGDGNRIEQSTTQKLYRDSLGRERREETVMATGVLAEAEMPHMVTISDPVDNVTYTLNTEQRSAQRSAGSGLRLFGPPLQGPFQVIGRNRELAIVPIANGSHFAKELLGSKNIEGVMAQGSRTTETIPAGQIGNLAPIQIVDETWFSGELQMNVLTTHSDPRSGETVYKLLNISREEPPKSLFAPPAGYTVTGPADDPTRWPAHTPK